jgi:Ca-activated chloride channel homolog
MDSLVTILLSMWAAPGWLWGLIVLPAIVAIYAVASQRRQRLLARFGNIELLARLSGDADQSLRWLKVALLALGIGMAVLAAARPQWGAVATVMEREGVDIVILLDTSLSMLAEDVAPDRLSAAKHEIGALVDRLSNDRVALVPFTGSAFVQCPLTSDYSSLKLFLRDISTYTVPDEGTAIGRAIRVGLEAYQGAEGRHKTMILITDGEDHDSDPIEAAREADRQGVRIYAVGIGSPDGELIPMPTRGGGSQYLRDEEGNVVKTRLDERTLREIAVETDGAFYRATPDEMELDEIFRDIDQLERSRYEEEQFVGRVDRYQWPLGMAVVVLLMVPFIPDRRRTTKPTSAGPNGHE